MGSDHSAPPSVVITGAAQGIGFGIAEQLISAGWIVVGLDKDLPALADAATTLGAHFLSVDGDVRVRADHERAAALARDAAPFRGWVNAAGVARGAHHSDLRCLVEGMHMGTVLGCAVAVQAWLAQPAGPTGERGSIVNLTPVRAAHRATDSFAHASTRAAVETATQQLAADQRHHGIRVNCIVPAPAAPAENVLADELATLARQIGRTTAFLLSEVAAGITGESLNADAFDGDEPVLDLATA